MLRQPIFLAPVFHEKIWGGNKLSELFDYKIPSNNTGEAWTISAHKNGPSKVMNGPFQGKSLAEVWQEQPALFGKQETSSDFPLLVKIIDAHEDLSVQVHPDDTYAQKVAGEPFGKTECWYILHAEPESEIVYGHHTNSKHEFMEHVSNGDWDHLLRKVRVNKGDFFYVPSGTIHAIGAGVVLLEIQQSSDITYRVYDYDRKDSDGNLRELHLEDAIHVTNFPHKENQFSTFITKEEDFISTKLIDATYFTVYHWELTGKICTPPPLKGDYLLVSVITGEGKIVIDNQSFPVKKGDHFILPATVSSYDLAGHMQLVVAHE